MSSRLRRRRRPPDPDRAALRRARLGARHQRQLQHRPRRRAAAAGDHAERDAEGRADRRATSSRWATTARRSARRSARRRRKRGCTSRSSQRGRRRRSCTRTRSGARCVSDRFCGARRRRHRGLRDAEGAGRRHHARASRVDSDPRQRPGHGPPGRKVRDDARASIPTATHSSSGGTGCTLGEPRVPEAVRHVEIVEFLLESVGRKEAAPWRS